jgi:Ase1/PRC1/MAP65 family protein
VDLSPPPSVFFGRCPPLTRFSMAELAQALESYSSHLESGFVQLPLPPADNGHSVPPAFDLSPSYVDRLDQEFTRVYEEYSRRVGTIKTLAENIIQLWAELGTPQAQTDAAIVKYYRDAPEQLGLHEEDIAQLRSKHDRLADEKKSREKRLKELRATAEALWDRLGIEDDDRKDFLGRNRGCGLRQINEFEDELARLQELKRQNLHLFVEDARYKLQELWDVLFLSEDEMLDFTPAFSDVYSDALLEAHEREIARLEAVREQRAPLLALVEHHKKLVRERDELAASSQDASRLMMRGQKGEKRDPGKLLREEKMRKRIAKELPKVSSELRKTLARWEEEYGRPFLVHGERYMDVLEGGGDGPPRSRTPAGAVAAMNSKQARAGPGIRPASAVKPAARNGTRAPLPAAPRSHARTANGQESPSRIPAARQPLGSLQHGANSPERGGRVLMRAPPPKMRGLVSRPEPEPAAGSMGRAAQYASSINVRQVEPEDVFAPPRHVSNTSSALSGSENWETYDDNSDGEEGAAADSYYERVRAARAKRVTPDGRGLQGSQAKRQRGLPAAGGPAALDMRRTASGSEWTDEDAF